MTTPSPSGEPPSSNGPASFRTQTVALRPLVQAVVAYVLADSTTHPDVEDCTHEVMKRALEGKDRLRDGEPLRPWLLGIARHVAIDHRRRRTRAKLRVASASNDSQDPETSLIELIADPSPAPDDLVVRAQRLAGIRTAMQALAPAQCEALMLFHVESLSYHEVAQRLGVPMGTVATWIARGRRTIAEALADESRTP